MGMDIDAAAKRGRGYLFVDGLAEMAAGVVFVLVGGVVLLGGLIRESRSWHRLRPQASASSS